MAKWQWRERNSILIGTKGRVDYWLVGGKKKGRE